MIDSLRPAALAVAVLVFAVTSEAAEKRPMKVDDLFRFKRVADPQISPDGKLVVYEVTTVDLEANKTHHRASGSPPTDGKTPPKQLTDPKGKKDPPALVARTASRSCSSRTAPARRSSGSSPADGGEPKQLTDISTGAGTGIWSPDGKHIAFVSAVYPGVQREAVRGERQAEQGEGRGDREEPGQGEGVHQALLPPLGQYVEDKRQHLFVMHAPTAGEPPRRDPRRPRRLPDRRRRSASATTSRSRPDGKHLVFTAVPEKDEAWSTNYDLCRVRDRRTRRRSGRR